MGKTLYVGNIPFSTTDAELQELFSQHGSVESVRIVTDRETGRSRGFAFVELDEAGADRALSLDGTEFGGRTLKVDSARERTRR